MLCGDKLGKSAGDGSEGNFVGREGGSEWRERALLRTFVHATRSRLATAARTKHVARCQLEEQGMLSVHMDMCMRGKAT